MNVTLRRALSYLKVSLLNVKMKCTGFPLNLETLEQQECIPVGCVLSAAVAISGKGGCLPGRGCLPGGGGVCPGVCVCFGGCLPRECTPLWGQTDTCENITFPQLLLRTVITVHLEKSCNFNTIPGTWYETWKKWQT